jgi:GNAT superfamily N-acetyltransferase
MLELASFKILPFNPSYQEGVRALAEAILCVEYKVQSDLSGDKDLRDIAATYAPPGSCFLVAVASGQVVGCGGILRLSERDCELRRLYVLAEHRRQGIAASMMGVLLPFVRKGGYRRILLEIRPEMEEDIRHYARFGFVHLTDKDDLPRPGTFMAIPL